MFRGFASSTAGLDLFESLTASGEFGEDRVDGGGPDEGFGACVPSSQEILDRGSEISDAKKGIAADALVGQLGEPTLNEVEPTATGGNVMDCLLYTSPSPRDRQKSRMPSSA